MTRHASSSSERRRDPRVAERLPLTLGVAELTIETHTVNVSSSGAYCETEHEIPLMTKIAVTVLLPSAATRKSGAFHQVTCRGVVVRNEVLAIQDHQATRYRIAVFFTDVKARDRQRLARYVQERIKR